MHHQPQALGLRRSFGFGDRLGNAGRGHLRAVRGSTFLPILAQQSIRELARTERRPEEVMQAARLAVEAEGFENPWGADADHLQTPQDARRLAAAGFTFFTIDPSGHLNEGLADRSSADLAQVVDGEEMLNTYADKTFEVAGSLGIRFEREALRRIIAKWQMALAFVQNMSNAIRMSMGTKTYELELSVDESSQVTSVEEHLFLGLELQRRGIHLTCLAPRFVGSFEKGIDYRGDLQDFADHYRAHAAIAAFCGPYKLSLHSGSDKFAIYPIIGRLSGDLLHVKTAGTSYLEALRVVARQDPAFMREIVGFAREHFLADCATYEISGRLEDVPERPEDAELESSYLDTDSGRQILHVTYGSVLRHTGFKPRLLELLEREDDLHQELLEAHLGKHIQLLESQG